MVSRQDLESAAEIVYRSMAPTPQYAWPLLAEELGAEIWVKHENHTPIGAFKVRGGLNHVHRILNEGPDIAGIISATRGNHGQSLAFAARAAGISCVIVVPLGNSREKNAAMKALGAELIEHGSDFDEARMHAAGLAETRGLRMVPSFHSDLVAGVGTYAMELFTACPDLDTVYAPIGLGSGICGILSARDALGLKTDVVGVVSELGDAYAKSFKARKVVETNSADTFADGMAVRVPDPAALEQILAGAARIVRVSETDIAEAMRIYYRCTHSIAEGAGAAGLAAAKAETASHRGKKVGVILSGQNIDRELYSQVLAGGTPGT